MKSEAVQTDCKLSLIDNLQNKSNHYHYYKSTIVNSSQRRQSWSFFTDLNHSIISVKTFMVTFVDA